MILLADMRTYFISGRRRVVPAQTESKNNGTKSLPSLGYKNISNASSVTTKLSAGPDEASEGKVIINKLHRFLRQRSVPAPSAGPGDGWENTNNNMKVQILSNSEGSSPMKETAQNGEISLLNEKNELTKNLLLATDLDETVRLEIFIVLHDALIHHQHSS